LAAVRIVHNFGYFDWTFWVDNSTFLGTTAEALGASLAIAFRLRLLTRERDTARAEELAARLLADTDPLTGLLNRRAFFEHAGPVWSTALRSNRHLSVLMADIDHFKEINDGYGHAMGDKVLAEISRLLAAACRSGDIAARWGGEEFVLLLPETDAAQACQLAERLRGEIECLKFGSAGQGFRLSASFGIAQLGDHESLDKLIHDADAWLYRAKQTGRNRVASNWQPSHA
jgi:diguanylate cyclase (GGDEF)-like protein